MESAVSAVVCDAHVDPVAQCVEVLVVVPAEGGQRERLDDRKPVRMGPGMQSHHVRQVERKLRLVHWFGED